MVRFFTSSLMLARNKEQEYYHVLYSWRLRVCSYIEKYFSGFASNDDRKGIKLLPYIVFILLLTILITERICRKLSRCSDTAKISRRNKYLRKKHVCATVGCQIAKVLGIPNPESYKGQCWRATAATFLANEGLNANEKKSIYYYFLF